MFMTDRAEAHLLRAVDYCRISDDKGAGTDEEGRGVARQAEANKARIRIGGWRHVDSLQDNDISATSGKKRPDFLRLLAMVRNNEVDVVVTNHLDRLLRSPMEAAELFDAMANAKCLLVISQGGELDLGSAIGRMVADILAVVARMEIALKSERQVLANAQRRKEGRAFAGGRVPFGYTKGLASVIPKEARLIRAAYGHVIAGGSVRSVAELWAKEGITSRFTGKPFTVIAVRDMLLHPRNAGILTHHGAEVRTGDWEAIVDEETYRDAATALRDPDRLLHSGSARKHLLSGLLHCGVCAPGSTSRLVSGWTTRKQKAGAKKVRQYMCRDGGEHLSRVAEHIETIVLEKTWERLAMPDAVQLLVRPERENVAALRRRVNQLRQGRANTLTLITEGVLSLSEAQADLAANAKEVAEIEASLYDSHHAPTLESLVTAAENAGGNAMARAAAVVAAWESMDFARRRAVIALLVKVTVFKGLGRRFNPATVQVEYLV